MLFILEKSWLIHPSFCRLEVQNDPKIYLYFLLDSKAARVVYYSGTPNGVAGDLENDTEEEKRKRQLIFLSEKSILKRKRKDDGLNTRV